jgi:hypothetical protein
MLIKTRLFLAAFVLALSLSAPGCDLKQLRTAATETDPATGRTPIQTISTAVPAIIAAPTALTEWSNLIEAATVLVVAGFGGNEWRKYRKGKLGSA